MTQAESQEEVVERKSEQGQKQLKKVLEGRAGHDATIVGAAADAVAVA